MNLLSWVQKQKKKEKQTGNGLRRLLFQHFYRVSPTLHSVVRAVRSLPCPGNWGQGGGAKKSPSSPGPYLSGSRVSSAKRLSSQALKPPESCSGVTPTCSVLEPLLSDLTDCHGTFHIKGKRGFGYGGKTI